MTSKRTLWLVLLILVVGAVLAYFSADASGQTTPVYAKTLSAGKHATGTPLSLLQVLEPSSVSFSVWGYDGSSWVRVAPFVQTGADTTLDLSSASPVLKFPWPRGSVIVVSAGSATFWGE